MQVYRRKDRQLALAFRPLFVLSEAEMASALASQFAAHQGPLPELGERAVREHIGTALFLDGMDGDDADWSEPVQQWAEATVRRVFGAVLDEAAQDFRDRDS